MRLTCAVAGLTLLFVLPMAGFLLLAQAFGLPASEHLLITWDFVRKAGCVGLLITWLAFLAEWGTKWGTKR